VSRSNVARQAAVDAGTDNYTIGVLPPDRTRRLLASSLPALVRLSDADLVRRAQSGDRAAVDVLVERYAARVGRIAAQVLDDVEDARDAAQESLLKLSVKLRQFRGDAQFSTWLHRLVVNTCRDVSERQRLRRSDTLDEAYAQRAGTEDADPTSHAVLGDLRKDLAAALGRLSAEQRQVVLLRDGLGLSYEEVARIASIPVGTAKSYVHRARLRLRAGLEGSAPA
jgi:RNA polymerase sigma-70 factor (ECF subfamily)